jgi:hypothetical protein
VMVKEEFVTTHSIGMWVVIEKKKLLIRDYEYQKGDYLLFLPSGGKERQRKCLFFTSRLIFYNTRLNDPTENEKKKFTPFLNFVFPF